jgi:hypothetical protein
MNDVELLSAIAHDFAKNGNYTLHGGTKLHSNDCTPGNLIGPFSSIQAIQIWCDYSYAIKGSGGY